ncbi:unnamed protein product, partial [Mesorhabditis belari]|uniref:glucuronosyltransferase n=1 Tax=Mesorhabditis belari TaxID=2138241 RepID=A0AAF3J5J9_9BILA
MKILIFLLLLVFSNAYKILVFSPTISRSHMISNGRIADELAKAGHNVTLFEPDFLSIWHKVKNAKLAKRLPVFGFSDALWKAISMFSSTFSEDSIVTSTQNMIEYSKAFNKQCGELLDKTDILEELKGEKFDAFFGEQLNGCGHGLAEVLGIKRKFWVSSCPMMDHMSWILGVPHPLSYVPSVGNVDIGNRPNFWERTQNIAEYFANVVAFGHYGHFDPLDEEFQKRYGSDFPSVQSLIRESDVIFVATDELIDFPRPLHPNIVHIGGLGIEEKEKKLDEIFSKELSKGAKGVVFFSFGSNVNTTQLPSEVLPTIIATFKRFPEYHFIAKIDKYDTVGHKAAEGLSNVFITEWAPQTAVLEHPRLKCMIAHGGYNSLMEAARAGKPVMIIPFFIDQFRNGQVLKKNGWGLSVHRKDLLKGGVEFEATLKQLLTDQKYTDGALRIRELIKRKPFSPEERLIKWTEFAISSGGLPELQTPAGELSTIMIRSCLLFLLLTICCSALFFGGGCCGGGGGGCCGGRKKRSADVQWAGVSGEDHDSLCNSAHLRNLINETISTTPEASKMALMTRLAAEGENSAVVLCSVSPFSYALPLHAEYCSLANPQNTCYDITFCGQSLAREIVKSATFAPILISNLEIAFQVASRRGSRVQAVGRHAYLNCGKGTQY